MVFLYSILWCELPTSCHCYSELPKSTICFLRNENAILYHFQSFLWTGAAIESTVQMSALVTKKVAEFLPQL